jgi:hypothetical protein
MITRLTSQGFELDLTDGVATPLNYSISDIREPNKRKRNFSKEIVLPATMNNIEFFKGSFNLTLSGTGAFFDPTIQVEAQLYKDDFVVMRGLIQLKSVTINNGSATFQVLIYSEAVDVFLSLSNIKVSELDWSAYNHTLNKTNIENTWATSNGSGYYYPMIDKGNRPSNLVWRTTDFVPYVYLREAFIKCFEFAGVDITGAFVNSARFSQVLFGYGGGELVSLPASEIQNRQVQLSNVEMNAVYEPNFSNGFNDIFIQSSFNIPINNNLISAATEVDLLNQWNNGVFTAQYPGQYELTFNLSGLRLEFGGVIQQPSSTFTATLRMFKNGAFQQDYSVGFTHTAPNTFIDLNFSNLPVINLSLLSGEQITFELRIFIRTQTDVDLTINDTTIGGVIQFDFTSVAISDGDDVVINRFIPDMTCADLVMNTFRQFNLYMTDIDDDTVEILPFPNFYSPTNQFDDWSELVDLGKDIIVKPAANEYGKRVKFTFAEINETDAVNYFDRWAKRYGDYINNQGSYFAKDDKEIKLGWGTIIPYNIPADNINQLIAPRFYIQDGVNEKACKAVARVMNRLPQQAIASGWTFQNAAQTSPTNPTTYPLVHHFNSISAPTFDLNFMLVDEVFYVATVATTVNAFSEYYFDMINEIVSPESKLVELFVYLTPEDIKNLSFKRLKMIDGALFRLNKVVDFDSDIAATTKVELIKVLRARNSGRVQLTLPLVGLPADIIAPQPTDPTGNVIRTPQNGIFSPLIIRG